MDAVTSLSNSIHTKCQRDLLGFKSATFTLHKAILSLQSRYIRLT